LRADLDDHVVLLVDTDALEDTDLIAYRYGEFGVEFGVFEGCIAN